MKNVLMVCVVAGVASAQVPMSPPTTARWQDSPFWQGTWDEPWARIGKDWMHPGNLSDVMRVWTAPKDGTVKIAGLVRKLDVNGGDGVTAKILLGTKELASVSIEKADAVGKQLSATTEVKKGQRICFLLNRRQSYANDTTGWDPVVSYVDGESFRASESFGSVQGKNGWTYEQPGPSKPEPVLYTVGEDLTLRPKSGGVVVTEKGFVEEGNLATLQAAYAKAIEGVENPPELPLLLLCLADWKLSGEKVTNVNARLKQRAKLVNDPLMKFGELMFATRRTPTWSHEVAQYFSWRQKPGGSIYRLKKPGVSLDVQDLINGQLGPGSYLEPRLSYDGRSIAFSYTRTDGAMKPQLMTQRNETDPVNIFTHIYEIGIDGTGLKQLTSGCYDDLMPEYLPDGGIAFVSTRRRATSRCFCYRYGERWHSYTVFRMARDGSKLMQLSWNDVNDWFPAVSETGHLLFARWDYIDRDAVTHQNLWSMRPDGTNPMAVWGNEAPNPHCTFQAKAVPGCSKIVAVASAHHAITGGPVILIDPTVDNNSLTAVTRVTPEPFPESEGMREIPFYNSPWPLSDKLFLVAFSHEGLRYQGHGERGIFNSDDALGLYVLDAKGNRELIYRDREIGAYSPIPLRARKMPPVLPSNLDPKLAERKLGEVFITDIYEGMPNCVRGTIKKLRIVQVFPKTTRDANNPRIGVAGEENTRAVLGETDVQADGSARVFVPSGKPFYFQAIDEAGLAYQTMRSSTSLMPGERVSCVGCHENKMTVSVKAGKVVDAMKRPAAELSPTRESGRPYGYAENVQPVWDKHCLRCHSGDKPSGGIDLSGKPLGQHTASYVNLCWTNRVDGKQERRVGRKSGKVIVPCYAQRNQVQVTPEGGANAARGSALMAMLKGGHGKCELTQEEFRAVGVWLDMNAVFYGVYEPAEQLKLQQQGKPVPMPQYE